MERITTKQWLKNNGYDDILELINQIEFNWSKQGKRTRRDWWEILAGDHNGHPRKIFGREVPVLKAAQIREGRPVTENAICRNENEGNVSKWETNRWPK